MGKGTMAKTEHDYLRLAQWAHKKYTDNPYIMKNRELRQKYIDTLAYFMDIEFAKAEEMAKDSDFRLPEEKENA
jgi:hypothetical protein